MRLAVRLVAGLALVAALETLELSVAWRAVVDLVADLAPGERADRMIAALLRRRGELAELAALRLAVVAIAGAIVRLVSGGSVGAALRCAGGAVLGAELVQAAVDLSITWAHGPAFTVQFVPRFPPAYAWSDEQFAAGWFVPATRALPFAAVLGSTSGGRGEKIAAATGVTAAITALEAGFACWRGSY